MIPLTTDVRLKRGIPPAVTAIIVGTLLLHVAVQSCIDFGWAEKDFRWKWMTFQLEDPNPFDWFLSLFSHANYGHWFGNMVFLWIFGSILEDRLGSLKFFLLFLASGFAADALQLSVYGLILYVLHSPISDFHMKSLGASGAISGIMGLAMSRFYKAKVLLLFQYNLVVWRRIAIPIWVFCAYTLGGDIIGFFTKDHVAHLSHIGGFLGGLAAAGWLGLKKESQEELWMEQAVLFRDSKMYADALREFQQVLALNPDNALAHQESGFCYWGLHNPARTGDPNLEKARKAFAEALELFLKQGKHHEAMLLFERVLKFFKLSDFPEKIPILLRAHQTPGDFAQALLTDDPAERLKILQENFKGQFHRGSYSSARQTLRELAEVLETRLMEPSLLEAAGEVCSRVKDQPGLDLYFEFLGKTGDERQTVRALSVLARTWMRTPKQTRLAFLYKGAKERLPKLDAFDEWVQLGEQLRG
jgi:membrane associated rhomboid family serine protease